MINLIFPAHCISCGISKTYCCDQCLARLPNAKPAPGRNITALFDYNDKRVHQLIWLLKYRGVREIAKIFANAIYDRVLDDLSEMEMFGAAGDNWVVVPIPLSARKQRRRGFNQTEEIAKALLRLNSRNFEAGFDLLARVKDTQSQMSLGKRRERWENVADAFRVGEPDQVRGRNLLLLDDVSTTGATLTEARRVLNAAGARNITALAVAQR